MSNDLIYPSGFRDALLRIVRRKYNEVPNTLETTLTEIFNNLGKEENVGNICIEHELTHEQIKELKNFDIAAEHIPFNPKSDFRLQDKPRYFRELRPLVIDQIDEKKVRIYTNRNFLHETLLAHKLIELADDTGYKSISLDNNSEVDKWQKKAIENSLSHRLSIISGGPGTGKTRTAGHILEKILSEKKNALIYLAAPTGKARNKLSSAIEEFPLCSEGKGQIISNTIHRWLITNTSTNSRPSENNPLECDVLVIDEASMISSELAYSFFKVIDPNKTQHVILLGDMNQLQAVEPGNVYAVISNEKGALGSKVTVLRENHRTEGKEILRLADEIQSAQERDPEDLYTAVWNVIDEGTRKNEISFHDKSSVENKVVYDEISRHIKNYAKCVKTSLCKKNPSDENLKLAWESYSSFRFIAASNHGGGGVEEINELCEGILKEELGIADTDENYCGRPIIIKKNDSFSGVANGDVGILYKETADGDWKVYLEDSAEELVKRPRLSDLPDYDTAFAITIHKAQGSEYDVVDVFLPDVTNDSDNRWNLATKELLYTAITRAKKHCGIFGPKEFFNNCLINPTRRISGLSDRLNEFKKLRENASQSGADQSEEQPTGVV